MREKILLVFFEKGIFPFKGNVFKIKEESEEESEEKEQCDFKKFIKYIGNESKGISYELFKNYFNSVVPSVLGKQLCKTKNKTKNNQLVNVIESGLTDLKYEIKKMSEDEIKIEKPYKIMDTIEKILKFNKRNQEGENLKILTPNQMLSRLPINLAQLISISSINLAGNNFEKLKNEIRQLLYSLCRSKKLTKEIFKGLIDII